jgi:hypothetical protein
LRLGKVLAGAGDIVVVIQDIDGGTAAILEFLEVQARPRRRPTRRRLGRTAANE